MSPLIGSKTGAWGEAKPIGTDWNVLLVVLEELDDGADVTLDVEDVLVEVAHEVGVCVILDVIVSVEVERGGDVWVVVPRVTVVV